MRGLHAGLLFMQGIPVLIVVFLAVWVSYHLRVAVTELRAIRTCLETIKGYWEGPDEESGRSQHESEVHAAARDTESA
jgi:hypothetical protein